MPRAAIARVTPDLILNPDQIGTELMRIAVSADSRRGEEFRRRCDTTQRA
jgi:hypothetical protein